MEASTTRSLSTPRTLQTTHSKIIKYTQYVSIQISDIFLQKKFKEKQ